MSRKKLAVASLLGPFVAVLAVLSMGQAGPPKFGDPLPDATGAELAAFRAGRDAFEHEEDVAEGLGPVFNEASCVACHNAGATGGGSERLETRFGRTVNGVFDPMDGSGVPGLARGGSLIQDRGIGTFNGVDFVGEVVAPPANTVALRRSTPLFGLGLVDNVPDRTFIDLQGRTGGRANIVLDVASGQMKVGRFGWKCQVGTLLTFAGVAYLDELGVTTPMFPFENCPQGRCRLLEANPAESPNDDDDDDPEAFAAFMTFLGPPPRGAVTARVMQGSDLFDQIGCAICHVRSLTTGPNASAALDGVTFFPFSDFLMHDMGRLNDGIAQGGAGTNEMRTAPLWGLRLLTTLLHDGSATTIPQAILRHDGEGLAARNAFSGLNGTQKNALIAFLKSL